ncbi:MAG: MFS transporter [Candidatus Kapaibacterium sp.]|nr:MAG: MFS transporter [Candidatus Kapabacteria bacterium]
MELWRRNLWSLWAAQVLAMIGMSAVVPFLPLFIRELGVSDAVGAHHWSGYIFSAPFLTAIIAQPIWGALADRYSRKTMVVRAVGGIAIALLLMGFSRTVEELFVWRLLQGAISGFIAAALGFVAAETPPNHRGYAIGILQTSQSVGAVVGPFVGGVISQYAGMRPVFWVMSGLSLVSGIVVVATVRESNASGLRSAKRVSAMDNLREALTIPSFGIALLCIVLSQMGTVMPSPQMPFFLEHIGVPTSHLQLVTGIVVGITGLSTLVSAPMIGKQVDRRGARTVVLTSAVVASVMLLLQGVTSSLWTILVARAMLGMALSGLVPALNAFLSTRIPEGRQSGMMSLASSAMLLGNLIAPPIGGWVAAQWSMRWMFVAAALCVGCIPVLLWWVRRQRAGSHPAPAGVN